jgi:hypothetical protein
MDRYEIRVAAHLDQRRARLHGCQELRLLPGGDSRLAFAAVDQADRAIQLSRIEQGVAEDRVCITDKQRPALGREGPLARASVPVRRE